MSPLFEIKADPPTPQPLFQPECVSRQHLNALKLYYPHEDVLYLPLPQSNCFKSLHHCIAMNLQ